MQNSAVFDGCVSKSTIAVERAHSQTKVLQMSSIPDDLDALLTREKAAAALSESGYPTSPKTLATMATRGGGPRFHRFGPRVLYRWRDALGWAEKRLSPAMQSTSERDVA
jgi:hypothetical protein